MWLNTIMLGGLLGVALPIAIHLLNRRPPTPRRWAAMRFLREAAEKHRRRIRRDDLILLLLRCLTVALLALAMARPVLDLGFALAGARHVTLVVDDTASTQRVEGLATRFDWIRAQALRVVSSMSAETRWTLVRLSDPTSQHRQLSRQAVLDMIGQLEPTDAGGVLVPALASAESSPVVYVGDDQAGTFEDLEAADRSITAVLMPPGDVSNRAIASVRPADGLLVPMRPARFHVELAQYGRSTDLSGTLTLDLLDASRGGHVVATTQSPISPLAASERRTIELAVRLPRAGQYVARARITADALAVDDVARHAFEVGSELSTLVVGDATSTLFVERALEASGGSIRSRTIDADSLEFEPLAGHALVILADVRALTPVAATRLGQYVRGGGSILVFTDSPIPGLESILPGRLSTTVERNPPVRASPADAGHALSPTPATLLPMLAVRSHAGCEAFDDARIAWRLEDGTPLLLDRNVDAGRVTLLTSTADARGSDLPLKPGLFVPLVYRVLGLAREIADPSQTIEAMGVRPRPSSIVTGIESSNDPIEGTLVRFNRAGSWLVDHRVTAVNVPAHESDLKPLDPVRRERLSSRVRFAPADDAKAARTEDNPDHALSLGLLLLAGVVLGGESILSRRFSRSR